MAKPPARPISPAKPLSKKQQAAIAGAVLVAAPLATQFEGYVSTARPDPVAIPTYCYGETENVDPARIYSKSECAALLRARMARDYAPAILRCLPTLEEVARRNIFGALLDAAYNTGSAAVCRSRMAAEIRAGDWPHACDGLIGWYTTGKDRRTGVRKQFPGLVRRRQAEAKVCRMPLAAPPPARAVVPPAQAPIQAPPPPRPLTLWQRLGRFFRNFFSG